MPSVSVPNVTGVCMHLSPRGILSSRRTSVVHPNDLFLTGHVCSISVPPPRPTQSASAPAQPLLPVPLPAGVGTAGDVGIAHSSNFPCELNPCVTALSTQVPTSDPLGTAPGSSVSISPKSNESICLPNLVEDVGRAVLPREAPGENLFLYPFQFLDVPSIPWLMAPSSTFQARYSHLCCCPHTCSLGQGLPSFPQTDPCDCLSPPASARTMLPPQGP